MIRLGFRSFLLEMETTMDEKQRIREIIQHLLDGDKAWFDEKFILVGNKGNFWVLNYLQGPRNEYNGLVRGMVVQQPPPGWTGEPLSLIRSFPFIRFYNQGEKEAATINFQNAEMLEKMDGCLSKDTKIAFCDGRQIRIKDIVEEKMPGPVWGFDLRSHKVVPTMITHWHDNGITDDWLTVRIKDDNNGNGVKTLHTTSNHLFYSPTIQNYSRADCLEGDVYRLRQGWVGDARSLVFGTMLGDGSLGKHPHFKGGWHISWTHANNQRALTDWYCKVLGIPFYLEENYATGYSHDKHRCVISRSELFEEVADVCLGDDLQKRINSKWLSEVDVVGLATWYMDDGSISYGRKGKQRPRALFHTEGFYEKEVEKLMEFLLNRFGIDSVKQKYRGYTGIRLNADAAERFWKLVCKYIIPELRYKLPEHLRDCECYWDNFSSKSVGMRVKKSQVLSVAKGNYHTSKKGRTRKYDITTGTSNFFANGILVHNSMVGVYFPNGDHTDPHWHTRKMVSADQGDMSRNLTTFGGKNFKFMPIIGEYVKRLSFAPEDVDYTYVFEFIHEASYVLTKYKPEQYGLYLLGARRLSTHRELTEQELDTVAVRLGVKRPRRWDAMASHEEIESMMKQMAQEIPDFEGFVFRDKETGHRLKVKDPDYVRRHHLLDKGRSFATLLSLILMGEEDEVLAYMPHLADRVKEVKTKYNAYLDKAVTTVQKWQAKGFKTRKDLAIPLFGQIYSPPQPGEEDVFLRTQILKNYHVKDAEVLRNNINNAMKEVALGSGKKAGQPKDLVAMLDLDDENNTVSDTSDI